MPERYRVFLSDLLGQSQQRTTGALLFANAVPGEPALQCWQLTDSGDQGVQLAG